MKNILLFFLVLFGIQSLSAQLSQRHVFPNSGGFAESASGTVSFTFGQSTIQTLQNGNVYLTQGFQQPDSKISVGTIDFLPEGTYSIFPNPNTGSFSIELNAQEEISGVIQIRSVLGQLIESRNLKANEYQYESFKLQEAQSGLYMMTLISNDQRILLSKLITIQL